MRIACFSAKSYTRRFFDQANEEHGHGHEIQYFETNLTADTAGLAEGAGAACAFVSDTLDRPALEALKEEGVGLVALRSAGYNNVDLDAAAELGFCVCRVPAYSPYAVAEHAVGLMLSLNRKIMRAFNRVRDGNFSLQGLIGFDMHGKTVGIVGTGAIGEKTGRILAGFGCRLLGYDPQPNDAFRELGGTYVELDELYAESSIITLHCPLVEATRHLIDWDAIQKMRDGVMIINTSRGGLLDTRAAIAGLKLGKIGYLGLDVYEEESGMFFEDLSEQGIPDDILARLVTMPNVVVTGHQAFFTETALENIAETTLENVSAWQKDETCPNAVVTPS